MALEGMRILATGATAGIGLACVEAALAAGADAACVVGRGAERGRAAEARLGPRARFLQADCAEPDAVERVVVEAAAHMGGIDGLVVSPGTTVLPQLLKRLSLAEIRETLTRDFAPVLYVVRAAYPVMAAGGGGAIVGIASDAGKVATPGESVIGAGMAGVVQFLRGVAVEGKRDGIRANAITPSLVEGTGLTDRLMEEGRFSAKLFAKARTLAGLGPTTPEDLAALCVFLLSPASARITGQAISVNGGISAA